MSSYPPTPAFGLFSFASPTTAVPVEQNQRPVSRQGRPSNILSQQSSNQPSDMSRESSTTGSNILFQSPARLSNGLKESPKRRSLYLPQQSPVGSPVPYEPTAQSTGKMSFRNSDRSLSDSLEEGELSEAEGTEHVSTIRNSVSSPKTGDEYSPSTTIPTLDSASNWNFQCHRGSSQANPLPLIRTRTPATEYNQRFDRTDKKQDPSNYLPGDRADKGRGVIQLHSPISHSGPLSKFAIKSDASNSLNHQPALSSTLKTNQSAANSFSQIQQEAQKAILDMIQCNVGFNDVIEETGVDPEHLRKLFTSLGLTAPTTPLVQKSLNRIAPPKAKVDPKPRSSHNEEIHKKTQDIRRRLENDQRARARKMNEISRQREATKQQEELRKRPIEVLAGQKTSQKIESVNLKKAPSPSVPSTPISSTPINAAVAKAQVPPVSPPISTPSNPKIPGLLLDQNEKTDPDLIVCGDGDIIMKNAPAPPIPVEIALGSTGLNGFSLPERGGSTRRKRPIAADLYTEAHSVKRKFGAQRSASLIIEVSEDEDSDSDLEFQPYDTKGYKSGDESQGGTPSETSGMNPGLRRTQTIPISNLPANGQSEALRKKEAEIQRLKEQIMAAQQKKKLLKTVSTVSTPVSTSSSATSLIAPPPLNGTSSTVKSELACKEIAAAPVIAERIKQLRDEQMQKAQEDVVLKEVEKTKAQKLQALLDEKKQIAMKDAETKRLQAKQAAKKQEEREEKKRLLNEVDSAREQKRIAREKLKAEIERIKLEEEKILLEEQRMEELKNTLTKELEEIDESRQITGKIVSEERTLESAKTLEDSVSTPKISGRLSPSCVNHATDQPQHPGHTVSALTPPVVIDSDDEKNVLSVQLPLRMAPRAIAVDSSLVVKTESSSNEAQIEMDIDDHCEPSIGKITYEDVDMGVLIIQEFHESSSEGSSECSSDESEDTSSDEDGVLEIPKSPKEHESKKNSTFNPNEETSDDHLEQHQETNIEFAVPAQLEITITKPSKTENFPDVFVPYQSPLAIFKSFRYHPEFNKFNPSGLRSLTYSNRINPMKPLCKYEINGGVCNDDMCEWQHFRQLSMGDDEILVELAENEGTTEEQKEVYGIGLRNTIVKLKEQGIKDFATVAQGIAAYRRKFFGDDTRVVRLNPSPI